jgi:hypothetical protein
VIVELWEQLLARERELFEQESTLLAKERGMVEGKHALGGRTWNAMLFTTRSHPSEGTIYPGCAPSPPVGGALWSLTRF